MTDNLPDVYYSSYAYLRRDGAHAAEPTRVNDLCRLLPRPKGRDWRKVNYADNVLQLGQVDGKQWAMPFTASTAIVYYNKDLLRSGRRRPEALPDAWDGIDQTSPGRSARRARRTACPTPSTNGATTGSGRR